MSHITASGAKRGEKTLSSESGSELGENGFGAGTFFLKDDLLDCQAASSASSPGKAVAPNLSRRPGAAASNEGANVAICDTCAVANDHGT